MSSVNLLCYEYSVLPVVLESEPKSTFHGLELGLDFNVLD